MKYNLSKLDAELRAAGIPIDGVSGTTVGRIDYRPEATREQRKQAAAILAAHDPYDYAAERRKEYPSCDALVVALWERDVEGRPESADALQKQREAVKAKWPKERS